MGAGYKKGKRNVTIYIICLCITLLGLAGLLLLSRNYQEITGQAQVKGGTLDLGEARLKEYGHVYLNGEWEFYPDQLIVTDWQQRKTPHEMISVPGRWMNDVATGGVDFLGEKASYRLVLTNVPVGERLVFMVQGLLSDYSLFINGEKAAFAQASEFTAQSPEIELVVEMQDNRLGGLYLTPQLEQYNFFRSWRVIYNFVTISLFAGLVFATVLFFVISIAGNTKRNYKYLFLFSLMTVLRYMVRVLSILPQFRDLIEKSNLEVLTPIISGFAIACLICAMYMSDAMARETAYKKARDILVISLAAGAAVSCIFWGPVFYLYFKIPLLCLALAGYAYTVVVMARAIRRQMDYALMMGIGTMIIFFGVMVDTLNVNEYFVFDVSYVLPICLVIFLILYAIILSRNEQKLYDSMDRNIKMQKEVISMEAATMAQRMQPHFLYNSLTAIQELCYTDPQKAADMIAHFSSYLRTNIDFLKQPEEIPFLQEFDFIQNYVELQKERYAESFSFETEFETTDFNIPPFTVEPLVENAIKHGAWRNQQNSRISLFVRRDKNGISIIVEDNGAGFDAQRVMEGGNQNTLSNIRKRLKYWKDATLTVTSSVGEGVRAEIWIPDNRGK